MSIEKFQRVALTEDLPEEGLEAGDIATVVEKIPASETEGTAGVALEVFDARGQTKTVVFVSETDVRALREGEIPHARQTG